MKTYVTYDTDGKLTGAYIQEVQPDHAANYLEVDSEVHANWVYYQANAARNGVQLIPPQPDTSPAELLTRAKLERKICINGWRAQANDKTFPHKGKHVAVDALSTKDLVITTGYIALFNTFPPDWPGGWKYTDNTYEPMPTIDDFKAMFHSMATAGTSNFNHSQALKVAVDEATTIEEVNAIVW